MEMKLKLIPILQQMHHDIGMVSQVRPGNCTLIIKACYMSVCVCVCAICVPYSVSAMCVCVCVCVPYSVSAMCVCVPYSVVPCVCVCAIQCECHV